LRRAAILTEKRFREETMKSVRPTPVHEDVHEIMRGLTPCDWNCQQQGASALDPWYQQRRQEFEDLIREFQVSWFTIFQSTLIHLT
jgi:hypothetical protein